MYKTVIGLEVHCELKSNSKNFSSARNGFSDIPNSNVSVVDMGMRGCEVPRCDPDDRIGIDG